jgi:two-component system chemotaxis sensor kinase CheA
MIARVGSLYYVVPIRVIRRIIKPEPQDIVPASAGGQHRLLRMGNELIPIQTLWRNAADHEIKESILLVVEQGQQSLALAMDELIRQQHIFVQPAPAHLAKTPGMAGLALLGDGLVGTVLNVAQLRLQR